MSKIKKVIISAMVLAMLASSYVAAFADDSYIYRFVPEYTVDFEDAIYEGESFPFETSLGSYNYADIAVSNDALKDYIVTAYNEDRGNVLKVLPHEENTNYFKTSANLANVFAADKIRARFDMYIPDSSGAELDMFIQAYNGKTGIIFKADSNGVYDTAGNKLFELEDITDQWITWEAEYTPFTDGTYVSTAYYIDGIKYVQERETSYTNAFGRYMSGGISELRFYCSNTQGEILFDNIEISGVYEDDEPVFTNTVEYIASVDTFTKNYVKNFEGYEDNSAHFTAEAAQGAKCTYQTRKAFTLGTFLDEYAEYSQDYYFPAGANVTLFTQLLSVAKGETAFGNSGVNRFLIPFEIKNGYIGPYNAYTADNFDTTTFNAAPVPEDEWFTLKTKIYRENGVMYFALDLISENTVTSLLPKTEVLWNADDYLKNGIFTFRTTIAQENAEAQSSLYIGNAVLSKKPAFEYTPFAWRDDKDEPVTGSLTDCAIRPEINITGYRYGQTPVNIYIAAYDSEGKLVDVKLCEDTLSEGVPKVVAADDEISVNENVAYVKAFLWDSDMQALVPCAEKTH